MSRPDVIPSKVIYAKFIDHYVDKLKLKIEKIENLYLDICVDREKEVVIGDFGQELFGVELSQWISSWRLVHIPFHTRNKQQDQGTAGSLGVR